ncbi:ABC transporter ATP-binding protein [Pseudoalteromonas luteoviolacea]|uniref:ABC transporter domain-containing protein n=1 Tax=Pseudoalteromonas luteoviolacea S4060-1 TaxID=1365257 RepID=A0A162BB92_9GAMM|nr:ABC transporter ATP-binding protein [Pseudoalteromonas luteoviolacea]KZN69568.1 hypothetical protein N478_10490 [Pseudoalteromonas luteoviolacea S4060-1]
MLQADKLSLNYQHKPVIQDLSVTIAHHQITAIVGPNGSGKSTLLKLLGGLSKPSEGAVTLEQKPLHKWRPKALAKKLALLGQNPQAPGGMLVRQLVGHGRFPYLGLFNTLSHIDQHAITWALRKTQLEHLQNQPLEHLSGGERQRAWLAMALAQQSEILLLDEPTTYLDLGHQFQLLDLLKQLQIHERKTIVMVLHDINQASQFSDRIIALKNGEIVADGSPHQVVTEQIIKQLFNIDVSIVPQRYGRTTKPLCLPIDSHNQITPNSAVPLRSAAI